LVKKAQANTINLSHLMHKLVSSSACYHGSVIPFIGIIIYSFTASYCGTKRISIFMGIELIKLYGVILAVHHVFILNLINSVMQQMTAESNVF